jgi:hypothetical protein
MRSGRSPTAERSQPRLSAFPGEAGTIDAMTKSKLMSRLRHAVVATGASILTGAVAGAVLARKPLVVRCDEQPRIRRLS